MGDTTRIPRRTTTAAARSHPDEAAELLAQVALTVTTVLTRLAAEHDMSLTQLRVLGILRDRTPRMTELADVLGLEKSTMSGLITRAERRGLVARVPDGDDARATTVTMTPAGHALAERMARQVHAGLRPFVDRIPAEEWRAIRGPLGRLAGSDP